MCLGENSAHHAVHYLNAQLGSLWENATECVQHAGNGLKPLDRVRYDFALAEYHVGTKQRSKFTMKDDMMFSAVFSKPRLEFVCNHEAVLYLKIKEGHFNRDYAKSESSSFVPNRSRNVQLHDMELAFRLEFNINGIRGHTSQIGNGSHVIQLLILNLNTAKLVSRVNVTGGHDALAFYLKKYLEFLNHAGHHVLFSLPDFDDDRLDVLIDYSLESHTIRNLDSEIDEVYGVSVAEINRNLSSKWLKSIMDAVDGKDRNSICLAEYRSTWTSVGDHSDLQFHVKFGAPRIKVLCQREAILYFKVDELLVYEGRNFDVKPLHTYTDWEIAVVVDLVKEVDGSFNLVKLDMSTIRFCNHFSKFSGFDLSLKFAATLKATFVDFIDYYATVVETARFHIVHLVDTTPRPDTSHGHGESESESDQEPWGPVRPTTPGADRPVRELEIVKKTNTSGFDFVQAVTQQTIVETFKHLWQISRDSTAEYIKILSKWSYGEDFKASFGALTIRYLSNGKAIVWIHLDDGALKPVKSTNTFDFSDWSIAFEVSFKMAQHEEVVSTSKSWFSRFTDSYAWKKHGNQEQRSLNHLVLDFSTAEFVYELSKFEGLDLGNRSAVENINGAVHYLKLHYLPLLTLQGHHILQSLPVWKAGSKPPPMALTAIKFQIYSKQTVDRHNCMHISHLFEPVLVLLGVSDFKPLPTGRLEYSTEWVTKKKRAISHGTVCLSRKVFLEKRLLPLLAQVNATTTVVPVFPGGQDMSQFVTIFNGHVGGEWGLALTTWAHHNQKKTRASKWELISGTESQYKWDYTDKWSYEHEGSIDDKNNGIYLVSCHTKNFLQLPNTFQHGSMDIVMHGSIEIGLGFKGASTHWNSKAVAKWSVTLCMTSQPGGSGMSVEIVGDTKPKFETFRVHGDEALENLVDLNSLHNLVRVDLDELVADLKGSFGGVWEHCFPGMAAYSLANPLFNAKGDILFELRPYVPASQVPAALTKPKVVKRIPSIIDSAPVAERPAPQKSKSLLRRIGDGIRGAGEAVVDVFDGNADDEAKEKSESKTDLTLKTMGSNTSMVSSTISSPATPAADRAALKTPAVEKSGSHSVTVISGSATNSPSVSRSVSFGISGDSKILPQITKSAVQVGNGAPAPAKAGNGVANGNGAAQPKPAAAVPPTA